MRVTIYGIPTCGTVQKARAWLRQEGVEHEWVDLREDRPSPDRVQAWVERFGALAMRNTSGGAFRALPAEKAGWSTNQWLTAFVEDPMLIKRPVVEIDGEPRLIGFREESWRAVLRT